MKFKVPGDTPMERLTNLTKGLVAVPKSEVLAMEKSLKKRKSKSGVASWFETNS